MLCCALIVGHFKGGTRYLPLLFIYCYYSTTCPLNLCSDFYFFSYFILFAFFSLSQSRLFNCINRLGLWLFVSAVNRQMIWLEIVVDYQRFVFFLSSLLVFLYNDFFSSCILCDLALM